MADLDNLQDGKNYYLDVAPPNAPSRIKGSNSLDWGMKNRLARIFDPQDSRTVMLAIDHGYFQGPTTGLERIDVTIVPLERSYRSSKPCRWRTKRLTKERPASTWDAISSNATLPRR
jgi:hypothetical protein